MCTRGEALCRCRGAVDCGPQAAATSRQRRHRRPNGRRSAPCAPQGAKSWRSGFVKPKPNPSGAKSGSKRALARATTTHKQASKQHDLCATAPPTVSCVAWRRNKSSLLPPTISGRAPAGSKGGHGVTWYCLHPSKECKPTCGGRPGSLACRAMPTLNPRGQARGVGAGTTSELGQVSSTLGGLTHGVGGRGKTRKMERHGHI